ncbi:MAG TPA: LamG domain-containing protein [Sedimentisphaerales bacterium]|nr:LamG domain-containing protein [Sedimentisphaerales bacterium]
MKRVLHLLLTLSFLCNISLAGYETGPSDAITNGLVARWEFEDNGNDISGNNHNGSLVGNVTYKDGLHGRCISLQGGAYFNAGGGKNIGDPDTWADIKGNLTLCFWFRSHDISYAGLAGFICKGEADAFRIEQDGGWEGTTCRFSIRDYREVYGTKKIVDSSWHHVAAVYNGSYVKLYVDGLLDKQSAASGVIKTNNDNLSIGNNEHLLLEHGVTSRSVQGLMDDVRVYNRALTASEISIIANDIYRKSYDPSPADGAAEQADTVYLNWQRGHGMVRYFDVYIGTDYDEVNGADTNASQVYGGRYYCEYYDAKNLNDGTTYYWRVDGVTENGNIYKGNVWSFTTQNLSGSLVANWGFEGNADDSSGNGYNGVITQTSPSSTYSFVPGPLGGQAFESLDGCYINITGSGAAGWADFKNSSMSISMWVKSSQSTSAATLISKGSNAYKISQYSTLSAGRVKTYANGPGASAGSTGAPYTGSTCFDDQWHHIVSVLSRSENKHKIYLDGQLAGTNCSRPTDSDPMVINTYDLAIGANPAAGTSYYFRGAIDDVRIYDYALTEQEVVTIFNPLASVNPNPANGGADAVLYPELSWEYAGGVTGYNVYLGTDSTAVDNAGTASSGIYKGYTDTNSITLAEGFDGETTYYWRVDSVVNTEVSKGMVWQFTTRKAGDFDGDDAVGYEDFRLLTVDWLAQGGVIADADGDGNCNMVDYALWAKNLSGTTYYVDSVGGSDTNLGTSVSQPWKTVAKANSVTLGPGDKLLFKAGSVYTGVQFKPKGKGANGAPVIIDMYGQGNKPLFEGQGLVSPVVYIYNMEYIEVGNFEVTNTGPTRVAGRTGVSFTLGDYGVGHHVYARNLFIHDVNGSLSKDEGGGIGLHFGAGGYFHPRSCYEDVLIEGCHLLRCDRDGMVIGFGYSGRFAWYPGHNIRVRNNLLEDIGGDGIIIFASDGAVVEYNVLDGGRTRCADWAAGIWPCGADNTIVQYNEVCNMVGTNDGEAFDDDGGCQGSIFQYNYSHDNDGGFLLECGGYDVEDIGSRNMIVRYNISQNDGDHTGASTRGGLSLYSDSVNDQIYNNIFYIDSEFSIDFIEFIHNGSNSQPGFKFYNNIFFSDGIANYRYNQGFSNYIFSNNVFYGTHTNLPTSSNSIFTNPLLMGIGTGGNGLDTVSGYMLQNASPCINAGTTINNNGGYDFWGNILYNGNTDIGVEEKP